MGLSIFQIPFRGKKKKGKKKDDSDDSDDSDDNEEEIRFIIELKIEAEKDDGEYDDNDIEEWFMEDGKKKKGLMDKLLGTYGLTIENDVFDDTYAKREGVYLLQYEVTCSVDNKDDHIRGGVESLLKDLKRMFVHTSEGKNEKFADTGHICTDVLLFEVA